ncbi:MAG: DNA-methyltransferase [Polyangia bacterium]
MLKAARQENGAAWSRSSDRDPAAARGQARRQFWKLPGASTKQHPAPFPLELADRLVRMFSFVEDTILDPFAGTGTTLLAAAEASRNAIGVEIDPHYHRLAKDRLKAVGGLFSKITVEIVG